MREVDPSELSGPPSYRFDQWADGKTYRAELGEDFEGTPEGFRSALRRWASRHGYAVHSRRDTTSVTFRIARPG